MKLNLGFIMFMVVAGGVSSTKTEEPVAEEQMLDPLDVEYFATGKLPANLTHTSLRGFNPVGDLALGLVNQFSARILLDLYKLLLHSPPKKLPLPGSALYGTLAEVKSYLPRALISMCPAQDILGFKCICTSSYSDVSIVEDKQQQSLTAIAVHKKDKQIVISYRPTLSIKNWITDLDYEWANLPIANNNKVKVHRGFLAHFKSTQAKSEEIVANLLKKYPTHTLHLTGYSLGSAAATLSVPHWQALIQSTNSTNKIKAYIYAGPRVGNQEFADYINNLKPVITRYTNRNDIVSHLPPRSYGFTHVGVEAHDPNPLFPWSNPSMLACTQAHDEDPECGWKDRFPISAVRHMIPLNKIFALPPYC